MKILLAFFAALVMACALVPEAKAENCPPGEVWVDDGNIVCVWYWTAYDGTGVWTFGCYNDGYCQSACFPYECADSRGKHIPAQPAKENPSPLFLR